MTTNTQQPVDEAPLAELPGGLAEEQARRAGAYSLLAALLRDAPDAALLEYTGGLAADAGPQGEGELLVSLSMLGLAAAHCAPDDLVEEYHQLFIGLGRGELVPYGSWYQTGYLMERPLGQLRDDLAALGFERQEGTHEPEDHAAALCEVMSLLIQDDTPVDVQAQFFTRHLAPWLSQFFHDLEQARSAVFYRSVARFGKAFIALETRYLGLPA